ncbi:putative Dehydrogenase/reductase SDR family member 11 [Hypsibius exemplaris]|uniref:Dehydrogenase/reductase SDR family member 11 n=1 Tax=Hypsibius exemplaris TaxID=2072580 RepID=A0A1W0WJ97_HYPEX|nr:putative Dehydrogenase/reductase SDR family member 11 [Hypsibius exemplaris]
MASLNGRIVLVTGASAGIGLATAETLANHGMKVIACARNIHAIEEEEVLVLFKGIADKFGGLDVLVNNAGMGGSGTGLLTGQYHAWQDMLNLNILGLTLCTREAVKLIESSGSKNGHIINLNSVAGHRVPVSPMRQFYSGTKHMVTALTKNLRTTLQPKNIRVTSLSPGLVETEFAQRSYGKEDPEGAAKMYTQIKALDAKDIADAIVYVLSAPAHVNVDELTVTPLQQRY